MLIGVGLVIARTSDIPLACLLGAIMLYNLFFAIRSIVNYKKLVVVDGVVRLHSRWNFRSKREEAGVESVKVFVVPADCHLLPNKQYVAKRFSLLVVIVNRGWIVVSAKRNPDDLVSAKEALESIGLPPAVEGKRVIECLAYM